MGREYARSQGRRRRLVAGGLLLACALVASAGMARSGAAGPGPVTPQRPNVVVVMADDQTLESLRVMPHVLGEIGDHGATFDNFFVSFSECCPSRSTFLTGDYAHNHHVMGNVPPRGGFERFEQFNGTNDLPLWLQEGGYATAQTGKYLNEYGEKDPTLIPPGWNSLQAVSGQIRYYNYAINANGRLRSYGAEPEDYVDSVLTDKATHFIDGRAPGGRPFFLYVAYKSPHIGGPHPSGDRCHGDAEPAPRHFGAFTNEPLPEPPSFNEADVSDKPDSISKLPLLTDERIAALRTKYQCELESLLGVDDGVASIVGALRRQQELRNTVVIYTSDNGLMHGEHRIAGGKVRLYEPSIHVPLLMRGPGIPAGVHVDDLAINADLAPTILDLAGATARRKIDGESLMPAIADPDRQTGRRLLLESKSYDGVRTQRYVYAEHRSGERELYDLDNDPYELQNVADAPAYADAQAALAADLTALRSCAGRTCREPVRLQLGLHYTRRHTVPHDPDSPLCAVKPVVARVTGPDAFLLRQATFRIHNATVQTTTAPFRVKLPGSAMSDRRPNEVHATPDLADGAELTLEDGFERTCG